MSHWNSGPDRTEALRHSDPMTPEQEEREALERLYYHVRDRTFGFDLAKD